MKTLTHLLIIALSITIFLTCKNEKASTPNPVVVSDDYDELGEIKFNFAGNEEAQEHFRKGLLLMHNFEYKDSRKEFIKAQEKDSTMAMAYWGEAMTHNHPLWRQQDYEKATEALAKLAKTSEERLALIPNEAEKDFYKMVEVLYGEGEKKDRDVLFNNYLEKMNVKYPQDNEIASFYALSCLGVSKKRNKENYEKGARIAKGIINENPNHPGALHYLIHSYDDPENAPKALEAANRYSRVAADATHALHMPSHIYVAVGMWDQVIKSNIASYKASVRKMEENELDDNARSYHAYHWLMYGHLQRGEFEKAKGIMKKMDTYITDESDIQPRSYLVTMKGNYLAETGDWQSPIADYSANKEGINIRFQGIFDYTEGYKAFVNKDAKRMKEMITKLGKDRAFASTNVGDNASPMCAAGASSETANKEDLAVLEILETQLRGLKEWDSEKAEKYLADAVDLEESKSYSYGPPRVIHPTRELYGRWLLKNNRFGEAKAQFEKALDRGPKRLHALHGLLLACQNLGQDAEAASIEQEMKETLEPADEAVKEQFLNVLRLTAL